MLASDASIAERVSSTLVKTIMNSKVAFGMDYNY